MIKQSLVIVAVVIALGFGFIYSGLYPMGADVQHNQITNWLLETLRERSIAKAAEDIVVPDLSSSDLLLSGGADYNDMCSSCHLKPGVDASDLSIGLYPKPPNLVSALDAHGHELSEEASLRRNYWIIKHGIKASGMPAWGPTHSDERIWAMVAFMQKLPELSSDQYQILTTRTADDDGSHH